MARMFVAFCPAGRRVYGVGTSPAEAVNDAVYQARVLRHEPWPWRDLATQETSEAGALLVLRANGPADLAAVERAA